MKLVKHTFFLTLLLIVLSSCSYSPTRYPIAQTPADIFIPPANEQNNNTTEVAPNQPGTGTHDVVDVSPGNYRFTMVNNPRKPSQRYQLEIKGSQASLSSKDEDLLISLISEEQNFDITLEGCLQLVTDRMTMDIPGFDAQEANPVVIGLEPGFKSTISGVLFDEPFIGSLVAARPWKGRCFTAIGLVLGDEADERWLTEGQPVFEAIIASLSFTYPTGSGRCEISNDDSYGYTPGNPIRTGNSNLMDGLPRQEAYLDALVTSDGKALSYSRTHSIVTDDNDILDVYALTIPGQDMPLTLYLEMYHFETLMAPMNLNCSIPFPIGAP